MKQSKRIKKLQLFLYSTGRMLPGYPWSKSRTAYPGEYYRFSKTISDGRIKGWFRRFHMECQACKGYGTEYVGRSEDNIGGYDTCQHCKGHMWSKKTYRLR